MSVSSSVRIGRPATRWLLAAACAMSVVSVGAKAQATLEVTNLDDNGAGSFREALSLASSGDVINFSDGVAGSILLASQLELNVGVTINGAGVTLDGVDQSIRLLRVDAPGETVTINNLTFVNGGVQGGNGGEAGFAGGGGGAGLGAAILADAGNLLLVETVFQDNEVVGGEGGTGSNVGDPTERRPGAGGGGLGGGGSPADGTDGFAGFAGGEGGTSELGVSNAGGAQGTAADEDGGDGADGTANDGGGGGGGSSQTGSGGDGGAGGLGGGGGGGGDGDVDGEGAVLDGFGGDGGFGGGGGGGAGEEVTEATPDAVRGGLGGVGGGDGAVNDLEAAAAAAGGGGAGLGAAIFIDEDATLTLQDVDFDLQTGNVATAGEGGSDSAEDGSASGSLVFVRGSGELVNLVVNDDLTLDIGGDAGEVLIANDDTVEPPDGVDAPGSGLRKFGQGELRLTNDDFGDAGSFGPNFELAEGSIVLDPSFFSFGSITIDPTLVPPVLPTDVLVVPTDPIDATLFGEGLIGNLNNVGGRVNPGDGAGTIGTLFVSDTFTQSAGGTLDIEVNGDGIDLLFVADFFGTGASSEANIAGTVNFIEESGGVPFETPLVFLQAETINGEFDNVTTLFLEDTQLTVATVSTGTITDPFFGLLQTREVTFEAPDPLTVLGSATDRSSSNAIGAFVGGLIAAGDPLGTTLVDALSGGAPLAANGVFTPQFVGALESQTAVVQNATAAAAVSSVSQANAVVRSRVSGVGLGRNEAPDLILQKIRSYDDLFTNPPASSHATEGGEGFVDSYDLGDEDEVFETRPFSLWVEGVAAGSDIDSDGSALGSSADTFGVTAGAEWRADDGRAVAGVFGASLRTDIDLDEIGDSGDIDTVLIGVYGSVPLGENYSVNGSFSVGILDFESERPTAAGTAQSDSDGTSLNGSIELLKHLTLDRRSVLSPFIGLEGSFVDRDGFTETGAGTLNLTGESENDEYLTILTGVQWVGDYRVGKDLRVKPAFRVGLGFQLLDESASTTTSFTASPGTSFTSSGADRGITSLRVGAGLELGPRYSNRWGVFARYTGDFASGGDDNIGQFGVRFAF